MKKILVLFLISIFLFILQHRFVASNHLTFSDSAKFADIARNIILSGKYVTNFTFFDPQLPVGTGPVFASWVPPLMPVSIALSFMVLGISDFSVQVVSGVFYLLLVASVFLLGRKIYGEVVGFLATLAVAANPNFLEYATTGASEPLFTFEIITAAYLFVSRKKWASIVGLLTLVLMYFTRPQAIIYIFGLLLLFFTINFPLKRALGYFSAIFLAGSLLFFLTSKQGAFAITQHLPGIPSSDALRGGVQSITASALFKKAFYNIYNFYRLLPQIMSPYMWGFFIVGLIKWGKDRTENSVKAATIFMVSLTFIVMAITIPFFRYLHPIIPLVYLFAVANLVWIVAQIVKDRKRITLISFVLVFLFVIGQTLGIIFLDSRFKGKTVNEGKPPVYVVLSRILKENTVASDLVVTNLDTWGTWYGERRTVWYPLNPGQLNLIDTRNPYDAIFLTSYLIDDENYFMGAEWRQIFKNPRSPQDEFIAQNYKLAKEFSISADETYERQEGRAILLVKR